MSTSILNDVKHNLGLLEDETTFDNDIMMMINATFGTLTQLGVGPVIGFQITSKDNLWAEYFTDPRLNAVKSYVYLCVAMQFTEPASGFAQAARERQKLEMEYRLNVVAEYG